MIADDSFYVAVGEKLSENEELVEPQVLFTQNWDIRLNSYDNTNDLAVVEIGKLCPLELSVETEEIRATETFDLSQYPYPFVKDGEMNSIIRIVMISSVSPFYRIFPVQINTIKIVFQNKIYTGLSKNFS